MTAPMPRRGVAWDVHVMTRGASGAPAGPQRHSQGMS
jgi:hypothetical protein